MPQRGAGGNGLARGVGFLLRKTDMRSGTERWSRCGVHATLSAMSRDARDTAAAYYAVCRRDMAADLEALGAHPQGIILYMPQLVVLMKAVDSRAPQTWEDLPHLPAEPDAWLLYPMAGDLSMARHLAAALPPLPWGCFFRGLRNKRPHRLPWERLVRGPHLF